MSTEKFVIVGLILVLSFIAVWGVVRPSLNLDSLTGITGNVVSSAELGEDSESSETANAESDKPQGSTNSGEEDVEKQELEELVLDKSNNVGSDGSSETCSGSDISCWKVVDDKCQKVTFSCSLDSYPICPSSWPHETYSECFDSIAYQPVCGNSVCESGEDDCFEDCGKREDSETIVQEEEIRAKLLCTNNCELGVTIRDYSYEKIDSDNYAVVVQVRASICPSYTGAYSIVNGELIKSEKGTMYAAENGAIVVGDYDWTTQPDGMNIDSFEAGRLTIHTQDLFDLKIVLRRPNTEIGGNFCNSAVAQVLEFV